MFKTRSYWIVYAALLGLTALTVALGYVELGPWHLPVGMAIASVKGLLIALIFMHALRAPRFIWIVGLSGLFWLGILLSLSFSDYGTRSWSLR